MHASECEEACDSGSYLPSTECQALDTCTHMDIPLFRQFKAITYVSVCACRCIFKYVISDIGISKNIYNPDDGSGCDGDMTSSGTLCHFAVTKSTLNGIHTHTHTLFRATDGICCGILILVHDVCAIISTVCIPNPDNKRFSTFSFFNG